jgi:hypothetical protein
MLVYSLFLEDADQPGKMDLIGIFSSEKIAEFVEEDWGRTYGVHEPMNFEIREHYIDDHLYRIQERMKEFGEI